MSLTGEYEPSPEQWVRDQVAEYEASGGQRANTLSRYAVAHHRCHDTGNKTGKIRKFALMRVDFCLLLPLLPTFAYFCLLLPTFAYFCLLLPTFAYFCLLLPTFAYFCLLLTTFDYF